MRKKRAFFPVVFLFCLSLCWIAAFYLQGYIFGFLHITLHPLMTQLIVSLSGFLMFVAIVYLVTHIFFGWKERQTRYFQSIIEAMKQIASGDYDVKLNKLPEHNDPDDPLSKIIDNINYMSEELGQVERMRQEFVSNVSHEMQSPLTSIGGFARALKNENISAAERLHYLSIIETESERLSKISDNLLKLTYLESSQHPFESQEYRLDKQLQRIVLNCEPQWMVKQLDVNLSLPRAMITADKALLDQVWMNLLNNAIKFTPDNGTISVSVAESEGELVVAISDTGIGISEEEQMHLFERFYKADKARSRNKGGSGLGLSIVKKIIEMHQGTINITSQPNKGTTFTVRFKAGTVPRPDNALK